MFHFLKKTYLYMLAVPLLFTVLGAASNQAVLYANHDRFPVSANLVRAKDLATDKATMLPDGIIMLDDIHCLMTDSTRLNVLADVFDFHATTESIGDLSLKLGEWLWTFAPFVWGAMIIRKVHQD